MQSGCKRVYSNTGVPHEEKSQVKQPNRTPKGDREKKKNKTPNPVEGNNKIKAEKNEIET